MLVPACPAKVFQDETIECHCPDASDEAFVVLKGTVGATRLIGQVEHVVEPLGFGATFKIGGLIGYDDGVRSARATDRVEIVAIDNRKLIEMFDSSSVLGYLCLKNLLRLIMRQSDKQLDHYLQPS